MSRYIRLLTNVLDWQKAQECMNLRIKCEPNFTSYSPKSPSNLLLTRDDNNKTDSLCQQYNIKTINCCDKNGNELSMLSPDGHLISKHKNHTNTMMHPHAPVRSAAGNLLRKSHKTITNSGLSKKHVIKLDENESLINRNTIVSSSSRSPSLLSLKKVCKTGEFHESKKLD